MIITLKRNLPTNCLSLLDHFVGLVLKGLIVRFVQDGTIYTILKT